MTWKSNYRLLKIFRNGLNKPKNAGILLILYQSSIFFKIQLPISSDYEKLSCKTMIWRYFGVKQGEPKQ